MLYDVGFSLSRAARPRTSRIGRVAAVFVVAVAMILLLTAATGGSPPG